MTVPEQPAAASSAPLSGERGAEARTRAPVQQGAVTRLGLTAYALALIVLILDQLSKWWVLEIFRLPERGTVELFPFLSLTMVWNRGVSFGLFQAEDAGRWLLAAFSLAVAVMLAFWARKADRSVLAVALGLVIGGAIGNLIDRVRLGAVADFIDVSGLGFFPWVFNIADSGISIGVVLLILDSFLPHKRRTR